MIISRAPARISIGGGGTDLRSYYSLYEGEWTSAAINKYIYVAVKPRFERAIKISYSKNEEVESVEQIQHPIIRETLKFLGIKSGIEIVTLADIPSNTGLGTSGSFTVALLAALYAFQNKMNGCNIPPKEEIAEQACHIAMNLLKEPSGKQDEYISACGSIASFSISRQGTVDIEPLYPKIINQKDMGQLDDNLLMFYTGIKRESKPVLQMQADATLKGEKDIIDNLHRVKELGKEIKQAIVSGEFRRFGELMDLHWREKIKRQGTSNPQINQWYEIAKENGALGGKLMGAGGGGFFLFYCENEKERLREAMKQQGLPEQEFHFEHEGLKIIMNEL
jgi:D-glycero-alpha-D-manno-heptose-7-phosphate kinase